MLETNDGSAISICACAEHWCSDKSTQNLICRLFFVALMIKYTRKLFFLRVVGVAFLGGLRAVVFCFSVGGWLGVIFCNVYNLCSRGLLNPPK